MFFSNLLSNLLSVLEVLLVVIPALMVVAFITLAERKTMASMQRRIGPNFVGFLGVLQPFNKRTNTRYFHTFRSLNNSPSGQRTPANINNANSKYHLDLRSESTKILHAKAIKGLYKDRISPAILFNGKILATCHNFVDPEERNRFLSEWGDKEGIYLIRFRFDPLVYYIGRTSKFQYRFRAHFKSQGKDKFHVYAKLVGWENFEWNIIQLCSKKEQGIIENSFLQTFFPLLNSTFISKSTETDIAQTLSSLLISKKNQLDPSDSLRTPAITVWVYKYNKTQIDKTPFAEYTSVAQASKSSGHGRPTISKYLDTNVPVRGLLYYSKPLTDFEQAFNLAMEMSEGFTLDPNIPKKVWAYEAKTLQLLNGKPFDSIGKVAKFTDLGFCSVSQCLDTWKPVSTVGLYFFSNPLTKDEIKKLAALYKEKGNFVFYRVKVWAYNAYTLELINGEAFINMQEAANYFNVGYRTIQNHLDTKLATSRNGQLIYWFSHELSSDLKSELEKVTIAKNATSEVWVYRKQQDGSIKLINENRPTFSSKIQSCTELKMSPKKLNKIIDSNISYKGLVFFSGEQKQV